MTRKILYLCGLVLLMTGAARAQWQQFPQTLYPALNNLLNALPAYQLGNAGPSTQTCTPGKDFFTNTNATPAVWYLCTGVNTWSQIPLSTTVISVFGRAGTVTAQTGDYTAAQVTNAVSLIAANTFSGGGLQNFSGVDFLEPNHASDPATCTAGQVEFNLSSGFKGCTATNTWTSFATGGGITQLTGDVTAGPGSGSQASTVVKLNGTTVPTNSTADQTLITTSAAVATWTSLSNCVANGGVIQYSTTSHTFSCHTLAATDIPASLTSTSSVNGTPIPLNSTLLASVITNVSPVFGGTTTITLNDGTLFNLGVLTGNTSIAIQSPIGNVSDYFLACMDATGGRVVTWPVAFKNVSQFDPHPNSCSMIGPIVLDGAGNYYKDGSTTVGLVALGATASVCNITVPLGQLCVWLDATSGTVIAKDNAGNLYKMPKCAGTTNTCASTDLADGSALVFNNNVNTGTAAMSLNMSASTVGNALRVPVVAGGTSGADGTIVYDSTNKNTHVRSGGADALAGAVTGTPANGDCSKFSVATGTVQIVDAGAPCGGGGTPFTDQTTYGFRDDFVTNNLVPSGGVCTGEAAYECTTLGSMTIHGLTPVANHPGIIECSSSTTNPSSCNIATSVDIQSAVNNAIPNLTGVAGWKFTCVFNLHQSSAAQEWVCGLSSGINHLPSNGIYMRFDNVSPFTDTNFSLTCAQSGVYSANSLGVAPSNAWHTAVIQPGTNTNTIKVTFDGTVTDNLCSSSTIPTTNLNLVFAYSNQSTTAGNLADLDFWAFSMPLTR